MKQIKYMSMPIKREKGDNEYGGYITTINRDRDGEIILPTGLMNKKEFLSSNPVVFYDHAWLFGQGDTKLPVGKALDLFIDEKGVKSTFRFSSLADKEGEFANKVKALVDDEILNTFSIGYLPHENIYDPEEIAKIMSANGIPVDQLPRFITTKWELMEYSIVGIPSNRESTIERNDAKSLKIKSFQEYVDSIIAKSASGANEPVKRLSVDEKIAGILRHGGK